MSRRSLRAELQNHLDRHTAKNRLRRIRRAGQAVLTFRYAVCPQEEVAQQEREWLRAFEDCHWDLPVFNSTRGYGREEDSHYGT